MESSYLLMSIGSQSMKWFGFGFDNV